MTNEVDKVIGSNLRLFRRAAGIPQTRLAQQLGVSSQQLQKYESGVNRLSASALWHLSGLLGVPLERFFDGVRGGKPMPDLTDIPELLDVVCKAKPEKRTAILSLLR